MKEIKAFPRVIAGLDEQADKLINRAIQIYNATPNKMGFQSNIPNRDNVVICHYVDEQERHIASLILDTARNSKTKKIVGVCQLLVVEQQWRGNGLCHALVKMASSICNQNNMEFAGSYVDNGEEMELWNKLGFPHQSNIGFYLTMTKRPISDMLGD